MWQKGERDSERESEKGERFLPVFQILSRCCFVHFTASVRLLYLCLIPPMQSMLSLFFLDADEKQVAANNPLITLHLSSKQY
jgi:hypothetical protein